MKLRANSDAALAAAAAALVATPMTAPVAFAASASKVKCYGVNACNGKGACKTAAISCKGQNACKGQGFTQLKNSMCLAKKGSLTPST